MIVVNMQDKSDGSKRTKEYFVPYLSIYPKSYIDTLTNTDQKNKPLFEAELALLVDIGVDEIDSLEFKYDKSIFDLDKVKLQDTKRTAAGKQFSMDKTIKITCKKEIPDLSSGEISVYAYPKDSKENRQPKEKQCEVLQERYRFYRMEKSDGRSRSLF